MYVRFNGVCQLCLKYCSREEASRDHVIPLNKGGTSEDSNVVLAHVECNEAKNYIAKAIKGAIIRQRIGIPVLSVRRNPGLFAPFSNLEDKP